MKRLNMFVVAMFFLGVGLIGCVSLPTVNQDSSKNNKVAYNKDLRECQEDYPEISSGAHAKQWIGCMNLKGWR